MLQDVVRVQNSREEKQYIMYMYTHLIVIVLLYHSVRYHENRFKNKHVMVQTKTGGVNFLTQNIV